MTQAQLLIENNTLEEQNCLMPQCGQWITNTILPEGTWEKWLIEPKADYSVGTCWGWAVHTSAIICNVGVSAAALACLLGK